MASIIDDRGQFQLGEYRNALVIGAEVFTDLLDFNDRRTCVLFGDGAGAVVLSRSDQPGILDLSCTPTGVMPACSRCPGASHEAGLREARTCIWKVLRSSSLASRYLLM